MAVKKKKFDEEPAELILDEPMGEAETAEDLIEELVDAGEEEEAAAPEAKEPAKPAPEPQPAKSRRDDIPEIGGFVEDVLVIRDYRAGKTAEEKLKMNWDKVIDYKRKGQIIESTITDAEPSEEQLRADIITSVLDFRVVIPDYQFFPAGSFKENFEAASEQEKYRRRLEKARAALGAKISFVIVGAESFVNENGKRIYTVIGSRLEAMNIKQQRYFRSANPVQPGCIVKANVISSGEHFATVEALGIECAMSGPDLSALEYIADCRDFCDSGDELHAVIKKIHYNEDGTIKITLSSSLLQQEELRENVSKIKVHAVCSGTVRNYNSARRHYVVVLDRKALALVSEDAVIEDSMLYKGDRVTVTVNRVTPTFVIGTAKRRRSRL